MQSEELMNAFELELQRIYGSVLSVQQALETFNPEHSRDDRVQSMKENLSIIHSRLEGLSYLVQECRNTVHHKEEESEEEPDLWM